MLGAYQVSQNGDIANWSVPQKAVMGMGGTMQLTASGAKTIVLMQHTALDENGNTILKLVPELTLPMTAENAVEKVIT